MKRKTIVVSLLMSAGMLATVFAPQVQAQENYPSVKGIKPFTIPANYMSLPGCLRWQYLIQSGRWISRPEAEQAVRNQGVSARFDPTNWRYQARQAFRKPLNSTFISQERGF